MECMNLDLLRIGNIPDLPNALCRNRSDLFFYDDDEDTDEAIGLCLRCPDLAPCTQWLASLAPKDRPRRCVVAAMVQP